MVRIIFVIISFIITNGNGLPIESSLIETGIFKILSVERIYDL